MGLADLFRSKQKSRPSKVVELLNLEAMATLFEYRVDRATRGITDTVKLRKADRRARKEITQNLEAIVLDIVTRHKPDIVLEIGAHGAEFSKSAKIASPGSRCIAIEGNPEVHKNFSASLSLDNVEYVNTCISDRRTEIEFHIPVYRDLSKASMGSMLKFHEHMADNNVKLQTVKTPALPLDEFLAGHQRRSKFMWIDVEGAIGSVLTGAQKSLKNCMGLYIEVETEKRWDGQTMLARDVYDVLAPHGFIPVLRDVQRKRWQHNVLYLHESIASRAYIGRASRRYLAPGQ